MQTLVKNIYNNIKIGGLNANKLVYGFGRIGSRPRKTLAETLNETKEVNREIFSFLYIIESRSKINRRKNSGARSL